MDFSEKTPFPKDPPPFRTRLRTRRNLGQNWGNVGQKLQWRSWEFSGDFIASTRNSGYSWWILEQVLAFPEKNWDWGGYGQLLLKIIESFRGRRGGQFYLVFAALRTPFSCSKVSLFFTLPALQKTLVDSFFEFAWESCIGKYRRSLAKFIWSPFPTRWSTKTLANSGKIRSKVRGKIREENLINSGNFHSFTFLT